MSSAATGRLVLAFGEPAAARAAAAALAPDNGIHLRTKVEGNALVLEADAETAMGLLRTLDDALACLRATGVA
jgi:hypothetical protein